MIVHEFGHGYWYGLTATNEFEAAWLDEGFNTYSTGLVLARAYGPGAIPFNFKGIPLSSFLRIPRVFDFETNRVAAIQTVRFDPVTAWSWKFYNRGSYGANVYMRAATLLGTLEDLLGEPAWSKESCGTTTCAIVSGIRPRPTSSASSTRSPART